MTVSELRKRLEDIERDGRGAQEVVIRVARTSRTTEYFTVKYASNGGLGGIPGCGLITEISARQHAVCGRRGWSIPAFERASGTKEVR